MYNNSNDVLHLELKYFNKYKDFGFVDRLDILSKIFF
jgi:hypothetical protein